MKKKKQKYCRASGNEVWLAWLGRGEEYGKKRVEAGARGKTDVSETIIVWDAVESTCVDLDGKSHREQAEAKHSRRERDVPGEEGEEIKGPTRKVIRVEPEESQDCRKRSKECVAGRSGREDFCTKCGQCYAENDDWLVTSSAARSHSASGSWRLWWLMKGEESHTTNFMLEVLNNSL